MVLNLKKTLLFTLMPLQGILLILIGDGIARIRVPDEIDPVFQIWVFFNYVPLLVSRLAWAPFILQEDWRQYADPVILMWIVGSNLLFWLPITHVLYNKFLKPKDVGNPKPV